MVEPSERDVFDLGSGIISGVRVLVTGANGFIGKAVCADLQSRGYDVLAVVRGTPPDAANLAGVQYLPMGDIDPAADWSDALPGVHLAARVHLMRETAPDPLAEFRRVNVALTLNLACQAALPDVNRFIFVSSINVNGENSPVGRPFTADDPPRPLDPYGVSKLDAEQALMELAATAGLEVVIIRPVLVYDPRVKANFEAMTRWVRKGVPLPFGVLRNRRSLVALDNVTDFIATCLSHSAATLVSDSEDLTVTALLQRIAQAFGRRARLLLVPAVMLRPWGSSLTRNPSFSGSAKRSRWTSRRTDACWVGIPRTTLTLH